MKKRITIDFETRSEVNLKTAGAYKYSLDPSTIPTCLAFKAPGKSGGILKFENINRMWRELPFKFRNDWYRIIDEGYEFSAHNAFFETCIYKNVLVDRYRWPDIPFRQFRCTAAKAASCALPRNLDGAGNAMNLRTQKDRQGYIAMMLTCQPTRAWKAWAKKKTSQPWEEPQKFLTPESHPEIFEVLYKYCAIDVMAEEELDSVLPDLNPLEQEIWFLNQQLNWRGLRIDISTVEKIVGIMAIENKKRLKELDTLTMGLVTKPGARQSILDYLKTEGIELPDIRAKTVEDALSDKSVKGDMRRLLEIRKALSRTSTKKYQGFLDRASGDGRVRDILLYHGAHTGRDTGTGIQPQNFPKPVIRMDKSDPYEPVNNVVECDHDTLTMLYGESLPIVFSSILRNMIIPTEGKELFVADFAKIEVAVLWWLADNEPGLKILRAGKDPYKYMAMANTGKTYEEIEDEGAERQLGKAQVLGCGFGLGPDKFRATAWDFYRLKLTVKQAKEAVYSYRSANRAVPELWDNHEISAIAAVEEPGSYFRAGKSVCHFSDGFLWIQLPSGRKLAYKSPTVSWRVREYEITDDSGPVEVKKKMRSEPKRTLEYWAVNSKTKKWSPHRTWGGTLTENIVQAVARDLMMPAMYRLEKKGYKALLSVHDEGICERELGKGNLQEFTKILCEQPAWGKGLPIEAKAWKGPRYRK